MLKSNFSQGDRRWPENYTSILMQRGLKITYEGTKKDDKWGQDMTKIFVDGEPLLQYIERESIHELFKKNILALCKNFDKRVHVFLNVIVKKNHKMPVSHYNYRVEFQMRGAG